MNRQKTKRNKKSGSIVMIVIFALIISSFIPLSDSEVAAAGTSEFDITISPDRVYGDLTATGVYELPAGADYTIKQYNALDGNTFTFLTTDGRVYSIGSTANGNAGIGVPKRDVLIAPMRVLAGEAALDGSNNFEEINGVKYLANMVGITACYAWDADGRVYSWGINANARLGIGSSDTGLIRYEPVRVRTDALRTHADDYESLPANGSFAAGFYMKNVEQVNILTGIPTMITKGDHRFYSWGIVGTWYAYANFQNANTYYAPRPVLAGEAANATLGSTDDYYTVSSINYLQNVDAACGGTEENLVVCGGRLYACGRNRANAGPTFVSGPNYSGGICRLPAGPSVHSGDKETLGTRVVFKDAKKVLCVTYNTYLILMDSGRLYGCGGNRSGMLNTGDPNNFADQNMSRPTTDTYIRIRAMADATADGNSEPDTAYPSGAKFINVDNIYRLHGGWWAVTKDGHVYATGQNTAGALGAGNDVRVNMQGTRVRASDAEFYGATYYFEPGDGKRYLKFQSSMVHNNWGCVLVGLFIGNEVLNWSNNSSYQQAVYDSATNILFGLSRDINNYLPRVYMTVEDIENKVTYLDPVRISPSGSYHFDTRIFNNGLYRMEVASPPYIVYEKEIPVTTIGTNDFTYDLNTTIGDDVRTADLHFTPYFRDNEIADIAAGNSYTAVLTPDRLIYTWGTSDILTTGALGNGLKASGASTANTVYRVLAGDAALDGSGNWVEIDGVKYLAKIEKIYAAYNHMIAVSFDGQVYTWGDNREGQLGIGTTGTYEDVPRRVLAGEAASATVVNAEELGLYHESCMANGSFAAGSYLKNISSIGYGRYNTAFLTKDTGLVFLTGRNNSSQLANGSTTGVSTPIRLQAGNMNKQDLYTNAFSASNTYETVSGRVYARNIKKLSFGYDHMAVLTVHNTPFVCGSNLQRQLGLIGGNGAAETGESAAIVNNTDHLRLIAVGQAITFAGENYRVLGFTGDPTIVPNRSGIGGSVKDIVAAPYATAFLFESGHVGVTGNSNAYGQNGTSTAGPHFDSNYLNYVVAGEAATDGSNNWQTMYSRTGAGSQVVLNKIVKFGAFTDECFTMLAMDGSLYSIGRSNGTTAYLGRTDISSTNRPVRIYAGVASNDPHDFETVGGKDYFKSSGIKLTASGNNLIVFTPMLNYYAFGAVENSPIFGRDVHDKISEILTSAIRDVELIGPYFDGWPDEIQKRINDITAKTEYIVNVPENGVYLAKMYYNGQLSGIDSLTITELDHIDLGKSVVSGASGPQNKIDYGFYLRHKYKVGQGEIVDDDLWILGPAGSGIDQFPVDVPGAGPAVLHITAAELQAMYDGGNNLAHIIGNLNVDAPGVYTAVIERSGLRPTPDNAWRIVQTKTISFGAYIITEKYQDEDGTTISPTTYTDLNENENYSKTPSDIPPHTYLGWRLDDDPTLRTGPIELSGVTEDHTVIMVYDKQEETTTETTTEEETTLPTQVDPTTKPTTTKPTDPPPGPPTGDDSNLLLLLSLCGLSLIVGAVAAIKRRKHGE